ncbi:hypothetical protein GOV06_01480 [Candidatus Woesearchaeota archaeon]|nr:hypothetical protein [Candidatus Woesearchaeota archaeon]
MAKQEPLEEQLRKIKVLDSSASKEPADLDKIIKVYESVLLDEEVDYNDFYDKAYSLIASKQDIHKFTSLFPKYEKESKRFKYMGGFLSGLINNLEENEEITLNLTGLTKLDDLGYKLSSRTLIIKGNVGDDLGSLMDSGKIIVEGNTRSHVGSMMKDGEILIKGNAGMGVGGLMEGGEIVIKGNAYLVGYLMQAGKITIEGDALDENDLGNNMVGGVIIVNGNAGKLIGQNMTGGIIHLNGDYESLSKKIKGGEIYHKGKQIYP